MYKMAQFVLQIGLISYLKETVNLDSHAFGIYWHGGLMGKVLQI